MLPPLARYLIGSVIVLTIFFGLGIITPLVSFFVNPIFVAPFVIPEIFFDNLQLYNMHAFYGWPTYRGFLFLVPFWIMVSLLMGFFLYKKRYAQSQKEGALQLKPFDFDCGFKIVFYTVSLSVILLVLSSIIKPFV